jgi:hypothetical protein
VWDPEFKTKYYHQKKKKKNPYFKGPYFQNLTVRSAPRFLPPPTSQKNTYSSHISILTRVKPGVREQLETGEMWTL